MQDVLRYLWVAALATGVNLGSAVIYREQLGMGFTSSVTAGYATGILVGFFLSRSFSFKNRTSSGAKTESVKFLFVTFCAYLVTMGAGWLILASLSYLFQVAPTWHDTAVAISGFTGQRWINRELLANAGGIGIGFFVNFFGHKFLTFRSTGALDRIRRKATT